MLITIIDDATIELHYCQFDHGETTNTCLAGLRAVIERFGIPRFIYIDRAGLCGGQKRQNLSEFERACNELGIKIIYANSPQGKGRIERSFRTFQDRRTTELRRRKITDLGKANLFLDKEIFRNNSDSKPWNLRLRFRIEGPCRRAQISTRYSRSSSTEG